MYDVNFSKDLCVTHYHTLRIEIGMDRLVHGVHSFPQEQVNHTSIVSLDFLYKYLGHPSFFMLAKFDSTTLNSSSSFLPSTSTICLQAEQS